MSSIDAVLSHRVNPFTSGVARFNHILAGELGVPVVPIFSTSLADFRQPLISIKVSEMDAETRFRAAAALRAAQPGARVFLHDWVGSELELSMVRRAAWVHCGNAAIEEAVRPHNPCCDTLWSPGSISDRRFIGLPEVAVLTFGMAHKIRAGEFSRLRTLLEETGRCFALYVSTANHAEASASRTDRRSTTRCGSSSAPSTSSSSARSPTSRSRMRFDERRSSPPSSPAACARTTPPSSPLSSTAPW